jgi:hypothetical protein
MKIMMSYDDMRQRLSWEQGEPSFNATLFAVLEELIAKVEALEKALSEVHHAE